jgi:hypothetical protein
MIPLTHNLSKALATSRKTAPVSRLSSKFLLTLSTRRASCSVMLCPGQNPNCSSRSSPLLFTFRRTLVSRIFWKRLPIVSNRLMGLWEEGIVWSFLGFRYHASVFPCWWEVLPTEDCVKHFLEKGYRALRAGSKWQVGCEGPDCRNRGAGCYPTGDGHVAQEKRWWETFWWPCELGKDVLPTTWLEEDVFLFLSRGQEGRFSGCLPREVVGWMPWLKTGEARLCLICIRLRGWSCGGVVISVASLMMSGPWVRMLAVTSVEVGVVFSCCRAFGYIWPLFSSLVSLMCSEMLVEMWRRVWPT